MINILYIDNDKTYVSEVLNHFEGSDLNFIHHTSLDEIKEKVLEFKIDIVLSSLENEKPSETLKKLENLKVPFAILSDNVSSSDEILTFSFGAQDFILKNTELEILDLRLRNIYNNITNRVVDILVHGKKCKLDIITRVITNNDDINITLKQKEFLIIYNLITNKNKIVSYDKLRDLLSESKDTEITEKYINVIIFRIRTKLKLYNLNSIRGKGYMWIEE